MALLITAENYPNSIGEKTFQLSRDLSHVLFPKVHSSHEAKDQRFSLPTRVFQATLGVSAVSIVGCVCKRKQAVKLI